MSEPPFLTKAKQRVSQALENGDTTEFMMAVHQGSAETMVHAAASLCEHAADVLRDECPFDTIPRSTVVLLLDMLSARIMALPVKFPRP